MPWVYAKSIQAKGIHPNFKGLTDDIIKKSIENGIAVRPYTINKDQDMKHLMALNCSAIITDDPVKAIKLRNNSKRDH